MKTRIYLLLAALVLFAASPASAQVTLNFGGGSNIASMGFSSDDIVVPDVESVRRFSLGIAADIPIRGAFGVQLGLTYSQKGASMQFMERGASGESLFEVDYIEFAPLGRFDLPLTQERVSAYLLAGPSVAFEVSCDATLSATIEGQSISMSESCSEDLNRSSVDIGLAGGAGVDIGLTDRLGLGLGLLYTHGLTDLDDAEGSTIKHRVVRLSTGFSYRL